MISLVPVTTIRNIRRVGPSAVLLVTMLAGIQAVYAQQAAGNPTADTDKALVEQIKQEVLRDLLEKGELDAAIDAGIQRYIM